jgi:hypothetical protein
VRAKHAHNPPINVRIGSHILSLHSSVQVPGSDIDDQCQNNGQQNRSRQWKKTGVIPPLDADIARELAKWKSCPPGDV